MKKKLIIVGASSFGEIALEYFSSSDEYEVVAFCVEKNYLNDRSYKNLPLVDFDGIEKIYSPKEHYIFVAITYLKMNEVRQRIANEAKTKGYKLASFISPFCVISGSAEIGEHCFIFEQNIIQTSVKVCDNVIIWSGNHIGHHTKIENNCFVSSHVVISGHCHIGENSFLGVNSTISNNVHIGSYNWLGPSSVITEDTESEALFGPTPTVPSKVKSKRFFKIKN
jgi:sugar O-acyltransferase (sialic acid O-acetyltransferase NeuD family)